MTDKQNTVEIKLYHGGTRGKVRINGEDVTPMLGGFTIECNAGVVVELTLKLLPEYVNFETDDAVINEVKKQ